MRILHTNFLRGWGGQSNRILTESIGVAARGHHVAISAPPGSELIKRAKAADLETFETVSYRGGFRLNYFTDVLALRRILAAGSFDILHLHGGRDTIIAAGALLTMKRVLWPRIIRTKHNVFPIHHHLPNRWMYGRFAEMLVALSGAIIDQCAAVPGVRRERIRRIPSAIDLARFDAVADQVRADRRSEFGFKDSDIVIGMVGRFRSEKGHDLLAAACAPILEAIPEARFLFIGAGSGFDEVLSGLRQNGMDGKLVAPGFRTDIPECLRAVDIYVQPSRSEGLGTSILEACASKLPVVATSVGGIPDIIRHEETGLLVEPENSAEIAKAVIRLARDQEFAGRLASAGRLHVEQEFSVPTLVQRTEAAYREILTWPRR